ncbi:sulfurtransferase [Bacillus suaedaesalsae]|uniref:Sulfurtransferase n=1 Tax=Bacillus suaedaesalsae TaxID=2810349 RepID=A0ABS2DLE4_9BACI|nr:sulfurtransferase [Bacillus suaedaesalsae]MBM6619312.1 sulfurtransferase [Bacillus suaedaesalsae]
MSNIKSFEWVLENIDNPNVRIFDCRFQLHDPAAGAKLYTEEHLPNAFYMDLEKDLSSEIQEHGGRHPLPDIQKLTEKLSRLGVDDLVTVVAYDDQNGAMASRLWWLMKYLGHEDVFVLNGNFSSWKEQGLPLDTAISAIKRRNFHPSIQKHIVASVEDVKAKLDNPQTILIDSREPNRYLGIEEPIDKISGHIPGAVNYFWQESFENGLWKNQAHLEKRFQNIPKDKEVIVYCGSGVTACPNILSLKEAGYENVLLYAGSWSDWITYSDNPISSK